MYHGKKEAERDQSIIVDEVRAYKLQPKNEISLRGEKASVGGCTDGWSSTKKGLLKALTSLSGEGDEFKIFRYARATIR